MPPALALPPIDPLDRRQRRRDQSIPTICVLSGPVGLAVSYWRTWAARHGRAVVYLSRTDPAAVVAEWVGSLTATGDLAGEAAAWLAPYTPDGADELRRRVTAMTAHDFEWFWGSLSLPADRSGAATVCRLVLSEAREGAAPGRIAERLLEGATDGARTMAGLAEIASNRPLPALLIAPAAGAERLTDAVRLLETFVAAVPKLPAAVAAEAGDVEALLRAGPPSHLLDVLREGVVRVPCLGEAELTDRLRAAGAAAAPASAARLAADGASEELAAAFADAARRAGRKDAPAEEDEARSAAERFLYERLESLAATAGLFALNRRLDFRHGPAPAEADLLAASLRLVIELDGSYFHLRDSAAYRRDRRKDWELQRRGYLVLRFLSDDVVERLEEILDTILAAVELRRDLQPERGRSS